MKFKINIDTPIIVLRGIIGDFQLSKNKDAQSVFWSMLSNASRLDLVNKFVLKRVTVDSMNNGILWLIINAILKVVYIQCCISV